MLFNNQGRNSQVSQNSKSYANIFSPNGEEVNKTSVLPAINNGKPQKGANLTQK